MQIHRLFSVVVACLLAAITTANAEVLLRKNIDNLTPTELAAYEHAIQIMMDRSDKNPYDKSGFVWQAWVHNCASVWVPTNGLPDGRAICGGAKPATGSYVRAHPGVCEHGKDLFLPWHRAQFYYFEKILQMTDPDGTIPDSRGVTGPSTKNVTVPFWNWTQPPSGKRYPKAFEDPASPLFHERRAHDAIAPDNAYAFASRFVVGFLLQFADWPQFGGYPLSSNGGYGDFEAISHNPMHSVYMAGDMANPRTAALDPGFYSFHAYIDLLFQQWIDLHGTDSITSKNHFLRGDQPDDVPDPPGHQDGAGLPSMGQVHAYLKTEPLGYSYEVLPADMPVARDALVELMQADPERPPVFGESTRSMFSALLSRGGFQPSVRPDVIRTVDYEIPTLSAPASRFVTRMERNADEADLSFQLDVYLYPKSAPFDADSEPFRSRYLVSSGVHWGSGTVPHHGGPPTMAVDVTRQVRSLIDAGRSGEQWNLTTAVSILPSLTTFGTPQVLQIPTP